MGVYYNLPLLPDPPTPCATVTPISLILSPCYVLETAQDMAKRRSAKSGNSRSSRKAAQNQPPESLIHVFENDWTDDWIEIADQLCDLLEIPGMLDCWLSFVLLNTPFSDLSTRSGLKQTHVKLDSIHKRLDDTLKFARSTGRTCIVTGVVAIYSKMCSLDAVLQEKLLSHGKSMQPISCITRHYTEV